MTIQILHYDFMGPIRLAEWGPPMEEVLYVLLARSKDKFSLVYAGQCGSSEDPGFFTKNPRFKCWIDQAGSEGNLYVAVRPMFGSSDRDRRMMVGKIVSKYSPHCNLAPEPEPEPAPRRDGADPPAVRCACCGSEMSLERELEQSNLYRCSECGISDTRLR